MNFLWLDDFLALAASGNFSRAAEERHVTQPAFSRRVRALEDWLGVALFDRSTQPATLTDAGEWFRGAAQDTLNRVARLPDEARAVAAASSATLRFAATHGLSLSFLPPWLRRLEAITPIGPIQLVSDVLPHCEALMQQGRVQFLLCHAHDAVPGRLDAAGFVSIQVGIDPLVPAVAPGADGRPRHRLDRDHDRGTALPMLAYSAESGLGRLLRTLRGEALAAARLEPVFTAHLATVLRSMALQGKGIAWLPRSLIEDDLAAGRLVEAGDAGWQVALEIRLYRRRGVEPPAAEALWRAASGCA